MATQTYTQHAPQATKIINLMIVEVVSAGVLSMDELVVAVVLSWPFSSSPPPFFSVQRAELWYILEVRAY